MEGNIGIRMLAISCISRVRPIEPHIFMQCHQSYLVNMVYIADIQKEVLMTNQKKIPVSARRRTETIQLYHQFFMKYFNEVAKKE